MFSTSSQAGYNSRLYNAIHSYLHNQNRAQPIVGLNSITEMWIYNQPAVYFCDVCFLRISKADIRNHIMGSLHRYNYIKSHHAHGWRSCIDLTLLARPLMDLAKSLEQKEGTGDVQVLCVDEVIYREMTSCPVPAAFAKLKSMNNQQNKVFQSLVHNHPVKGNETNVQALQEFENRHEIKQPPISECLTPTQCVPSTPLRSNCSSIIQSLSQPLNLTPALSLPRNPSPVRQLSISKEESTPQNRVDSHVTAGMLNLESYLAPSFSQQTNSYQHGMHDRNQSSQRCMMPSETRTPNICVVRPPRPRTLIRIACQNDTAHISEEVRNGVMHSLQLATTIDPYKPQLRTSPLTVSHMVPEIIQNLTIRQDFFRNESLSDCPDPTSAFHLASIVEPIITPRITEALEPAFTHDSNQFLEPDFQEPISTGWEANVTVEEENITLSSQNSILQSPFTQTPSAQIQSPEDSPENYTGRKPLIGLQAVIKCQSVDGDPPPCFYLCQLCSVKLKKKKMTSHLTGCLHQRIYLKVLHPQLLPNIKHKWCKINEMLEDIAIQLEKEDGRGQIKVMRLSACLFSEVLQRDYRWCMKILNCGTNVGSFTGGTDKTSGPNKALKRPAESILSTIHIDGTPLLTHHRSKKKKVCAKKVMCANTVKEPVFKVSLSLQEGPVVIERMNLRHTATVAPEIEHEVHIH